VAELYGSFGACGDLIEAAFSDVTAACEPRATNGRDGWALQVATEVRRSDPTRWNELNTGVLVGGKNCVEHRKSTGGFRRKKLQQQAAKATSCFDLSRCLHTWDKRQATRLRSLDGGGQAARSEGKASPCVGCGINGVRIEHSARSHEKLRPLCREQTNHLRGDRRPKRDLDDRQAGGKKRIGKWQSIFNAVDRNHRDKAMRSEYVTWLLLLVRHEIPSLGVASRFPEEGGRYCWFYLPASRPANEESSWEQSHVSEPSTLSPNDEDLARAAELVESVGQVRAQVARAIVGQDAVVEQLIIAILARGHCLLQGVPGLAKTLMVRSLADAMHLSFHRIQFTPDLMPADITGTDLIQESEAGHRDLVFEKGPIFTQMLLADEINRTPPKTQAALLEAMQEHAVTVGGKTYRLEEPFFVLATQNPIEQEGTYPLPEAQRDRFLFQVLVDYPSRDEESEIIERTTSSALATPEPVVTSEQIVAFQSTVRRVPLADHVKQYVLDLVRSLRPGAGSPLTWVDELVDWGPGPRAGQQLVLAAKAASLLAGRTHVTIPDVRRLAAAVLRHRIVPTFRAQSEGVTPDDLVSRAMESLPEPAVQSL